jgi:haloalkane dehalogenase
MSEFNATRRQIFAGVGAAGVAGALAAGTASAAEICDLDKSNPRSWRDGKKFAEVFGRKMAYYEVGEGKPIVFLHGNPTSSYLWRDVIPHVSHLGRCIAPDLIGQGDSDKLPNAGPGTYSFLTHRKYLFELFRILGVEQDVTLVLHDWGTGLGFEFASHHPAAMRGIAYMEAIMRMPGSPPPDPASAGGLFGRFLSDEGEDMILQQNIFVEQVLIGGLGTYLSEADRAEYRRPFLEPGAGRWPSLEWPRQLPAFSAETAPIAEAYTNWLATDETVPKLFVHALPGAIFANKDLLDYVRGFKNQTEVTVYSTHYVPEFAPHALGRAIAEWLGKIG